MQDFSTSMFFDWIYLKCKVYSRTRGSQKVTVPRSFQGCVQLGTDILYELFVRSLENYDFRVAEFWQHWNKPSLQGTATANNSHCEERWLQRTSTAKNSRWHSSIVSSFPVGPPCHLCLAFAWFFSMLLSLAGPPAGCWAMSGQKAFRSRPDLVPILSTAPNPNPRLKRPIKTLTQLCNPTAGCRVAGF